MNYIKLKTDFFDNEKLKAIRATKDGNSIILFYLTLIIVAVKADENGKLMLSENIPYNSELFVGILGFTEVIVKSGLELLQKFGLIALEKDIYCVIDYTNFIDVKRKQSTERQAKFKAKQNTKSQILTNVTEGDKSRP